jgi:hypothetical protein
MEESRKISQKLDIEWLQERISYYTGLVDTLRKTVLD